MRDDRSELAEIVITYFSPITYKVRKTGAIHHARFLGKAIYYINIWLLSNILTFVQESDKLKIEIKLITFIFCFYAKWFYTTQSNDVIKAPFLDITAIHIRSVFRSPEQKSSYLSQTSTLEECKPHFLAQYWLQ